MNTNSVIIIQPLVPSYRVPFFITLAKKWKRKITILHFGKKVNFNHPLIEEKVSDIYSFLGIKWVISLNRIIRDYSTILTVFDPHWTNLFFLPITQKNKKIILWGHGFGKNNLFNKVRISLFNRTHSIIAYSNKRKQKIIESGIDEKKIFVANNTIYVPNATDTSSFLKKNFIYVGRLQRRKKLDVFFDIFFKLNLGDKGFRFTVIGDGEQEKTFLLNRAMQLGIMKFIDFIEGTTDNDKLLEYFSKAIYYISPGAVGLGVLHSFAYGVPVLTMEDWNHGPEVDNIIQNENGFVFKDETEFQKKFNDLLNLVVSKQLGKNAFQFYKDKRSVDRMAEDFLRAIEYIQ
jgi:glycosyltransferase involved in cell wall biosynthesis